MTISPAIIAGGAFQNVTARPSNGAAITVRTGTANAAYTQKPVGSDFPSDGNFWSHQHGSMFGFRHSIREEICQGSLARNLVHLDAYRLDTAAQIEALLLEDFLNPPWCLAVEWPEKISAWIPSDTLHLDLGITADEHHTIRLR